MFIILKGKTGFLFSPVFHPKSKAKDFILSDIFFILYLYSFLEGKGGEKEEEKDV